MAPLKSFYTIKEIAEKKLIGLTSYKGVYNKVAGGLLEDSGERHPKKTNGKTYGFRKISRKAIEAYRVRH